jgi:multiple sugar transport system ATP-binding protein
MASVSFKEVGKVYPDGTRAIDSVELEIDDGEFVVFVGPSGCGKSTLLRMLAGLEDITSGGVFIGDELVNDIGPRDRDIAMVFQNYALYPQMTVYGNIAFALKQRKVSKPEIDQRVREAARTLDLTEHLNRKPGQLSGGQRQRVAMGRAIVREPTVLLLDEPLSNLDAKLRVQMRSELARLHSRIGTTTIFVTHDQTEAMTLGDRVAVFSRGELQQFDKPRELYRRPRNIFVAGFIGSPAMNFLEACIVADGDNRMVELGDHLLPLPSAVALGVTGDVVLGVRPEAVSVRAGVAGEVPLPGRVVLVEHVEPESYVELDLLGGVRTRTADEFTALADIETLPDARSALLARVKSSEAPAAGSDVTAVVDLAHSHVFNRTTGEAC